MNGKERELSLLRFENRLEEREERLLEPRLKKGNEETREWIEKIIQDMSRK